MKYFLLMIAGVALVGCGKEGERLLPPEPPKAAPEKLMADPIIEKAIRGDLNKPTGELTKADLEKVRELYLGDSQLTEVPRGLERLTQLKSLFLTANQLTNVKGLEKLTQLEELLIDANQLTNVTGLEKLTKLKMLSLMHNQLTDVKGLEKLTQLEELLLYNNKLTDVKGLEKLTELTTLYLMDNPDLTKAQIDQLQKALPKCKIGSNTKK
jgi:Leucine-rich repeat (LRR) protein